MFSLDLKIFNLIHQLAGHNRLIDLLGIFFADYSGYIIALIAIFLIFSSKTIKGNIYNLAFVSLVLLISRGIISETLRFFLPRVRPFVRLGFTPLISQSATESSMPSGHMAFFFGLSFALYFLGKKTWSYVFMAVSLLMGIARIFVGVHWPGDILAGIVIAFVSAFIVNWTLVTKKSQIQ
ncbi:MAG: phosphatase PAP2 family protein [Patescibacteria group bacterium]|nr:phosphatase PAP2 family protein [Patescibacteria group bacterium]